MNEIFIIIGLILLNGLFAMTEIAMISARKSNLSTEAKNGSESARLALDMAERPDRMLSTVQIGITLIGILTGIYSGSKLAGGFADWMESLGMSEVYSESVAQITIVVIVTYLTLVFGELLPKRIGMSVAEKVAKFMVRPMNFLAAISSPFVWLLSKSTAFIFSLLGLHEEGSKVTEEEIKSIIQEGTDNGEVQPVEQDIVERVFLMGDLTVGSIMTSKHDLVWFDIEMTADEVRKVMSEEIYENYPVADGDLDHVKGFASLKDLFIELNKPDFCLKNLIQPATYFHENMSVYKMLEQMKSLNVCRGLVCDEFGGCIGIVTLKDMMEGFVGSMGEEAPDEASIIKCEGREAWLVDGQCSLYDFLTYFDCEELLEDNDFTTVAGLCLNQLDRIPATGEQFDWHHFRFEVVDKDEARIDKLMVTKLTSETDTEGTEDEAE